LAVSSQIDHYKNDQYRLFPVRDAIAVQQQHQDWAKEVMLETWQYPIDGVKTKVKVKVKVKLALP
jgi:hypothetical protein